MNKYQNHAPMLKNIPSEDIQKKIHDKTMPGFMYIGIPCHSQAVERMIKLVTNLVESLYREQTRFYMLCYSRARMSKFDPACGRVVRLELRQNSKMVTSLWSVLGYFASSELKTLETKYADSSM